MKYFNHTEYFNCSIQQEVCKENWEKKPWYCGAVFSIILNKTSKRKFQTRRAIVKLEFLRISSDFIQQEEILQSLDFARNSLKRGIVWISWLVCRNISLNPLTLKSDSHLISPYNINLEAHIQVARVWKMITN